MAVPLQDRMKHCLNHNKHEELYGCGYFCEQAFIWIDPNNNHFMTEVNCSCCCWGQTHNTQFVRTRDNNETV